MLNKECCYVQWGTLLYLCVVFFKSVSLIQFEVSCLISASMTWRAAISWQLVADGPGLSMVKSIFNCQETSDLWVISTVENNDVKRKRVTNILHAANLKCSLSWMWGHVSELSFYWYCKCEWSKSSLISGQPRNSFLIFHWIPKEILGTSHWWRVADIKGYLSIYLGIFFFIFFCINDVQMQYGFKQASSLVNVLLF